MNSDLEKQILNTYFSTNTKDFIDKDSFKYYEEDFKNYEKHRVFTPKQKEECWKLASLIPRRDPSRWRYDAIGNPVLKTLRGCMGPLCHEYDHIYPHSKGGETRLNNCQVLQTRVNRDKSNKLNYSIEDMKKASIKINFSEEEMDYIESLIYGNVRKG